MPDDPRPALLNAALDAAERGWPVFPLLPGSKRPALHAEHACPRTGDCASGHAKWEQRASIDPARIRAAWAHRPYNIGIATGPAELVVIDLDKPKNQTDAPCGATTFHALCERAGQAVPTTRRVRTASGGEHLYFTASPGVRLANTAGRLGPLVDTRAWGGYVVAPGSTLPHGAYEVTDHAPPAPLPRWLLDALAPPPPPRPTAGTPAVSSAVPGYVAAALRNETANVAGASEGVRNWTLVRAARALGRFVASGDLARHVVEQALKEAGQAAGLRESECTPAITSALNWSIAHNGAGHRRAA
ncbi:bifunctional DNA primase/polymerase [Streptomyces sp. TRM 70351]|uniref:bifunctional DNA primase/polymerase n=1 Tax=Streptomyces sp. TRM 70351 TaxID=3116552 RepID=UPI002E7C3AFD|nr:bifunctional DNA primase/polymerase [Streptomyces sp. TRM 70351]MEE1929833.1 bifunctional DNA primase/polymerase [Streptomyces sp. TRM 70351]